MRISQIPANNAECGGAVELYVCDLTEATGERMASDSHAAQGAQGVHDGGLRLPQLGVAFPV